jgi:NAD(P)-dependent dehydrogenase (short-subunit alcohol dehydrogenase family)
MQPGAPPVPASIVVTGAGRGIGAAIAHDLAATTAASLLLVSRTANAERVAESVNARRAGAAQGFAWDIGESGSARDRVFAALERSPGPVALVHAAGILGPTGPFVENDPDRWWQAFSENLGGAVRLVHGVLGRMLREKAGRIVLFGGGGAAYGYPNFSSYGTAKAALVRFVETLAMELADAGPVITIIAPGANETDMLAEVRRAGGFVKTTVSIDEPCRLVRRLMTEDTRGLNGRFVHVRDEWDEASALALSDDHWKLRRIQ